MTSLAEKLGRRVVACRVAVGLTQVELAERAGVVVETISRLERGVSVPSLARLDAIAQGLGTPLAELLRLDDEDAARQAELDALHALLAGRPAADVAAVVRLARALFSGAR